MRVRLCSSIQNIPNRCSTSRSQSECRVQLERPSAAARFHILTGRLSSSQRSWKSDCTRDGWRERRRRVNVMFQQKQVNSTGLFQKQIIKSAFLRSSVGEAERRQVGRGEESGLADTNVIVTRNNLACYYKLPCLYVLYASSVRLSMFS